MNYFDDILNGKYLLTVHFENGMVLGDIYLDLEEEIDNYVESFAAYPVPYEKIIVADGETEEVIRIITP